MRPQVFAVFVIGIAALAIGLMIVIRTYSSTKTPFTSVENLVGMAFILIGILASSVGAVLKNYGDRLRRFENTADVSK